jgi:hypothetical protein
MTDALCNRIAAAKAPILTSWRPGLAQAGIACFGHVVLSIPFGLYVRAAARAWLTLSVCAAQLTNEFTITY